VGRMVVVAVGAVVNTKMVLAGECALGRPAAPAAILDERAVRGEGAVTPRGV
jgi:hypothetical protein